MKAILFFLLIPLIGVPQNNKLNMQKITYPSSDGIIITADLYIVNESLPYMVLCHQARYSRGEYLETVKQFCDLGYNCLAPDSRSGKEVNGVYNETASLATKKGKPSEYLDAEIDILASANYAYQKSGQKIILVGSSYSASLVLKIATENPKVKAVLAFSPGEYFGDKLKLKESITELVVPVFITSSHEESAALTILMSDVQSLIKQQFIPSKDGKHGSSALWKNNPNHQEYWDAVNDFMKKIK